MRNKGGLTLPHAGFHEFFVEISSTPYANAEKYAKISLTLCDGEEYRMAKPVYQRVLLKISGEALAGGKGTGLDFEMIGSVCDVIKECLDMGVQMGLVVLFQKPPLVDNAVAFVPATE